MVAGHVPPDHPDYLVIAVALATYPHSHRMSFIVVAPSSPWLLFRA